MAEELSIELSDQVKEQMAKDPALAGAMREMCALMRQAHAGVEAGKYATFNDAMEALTGNRPQLVSDEP